GTGFRKRKVGSPTAGAIAAAGKYSNSQLPLLGPGHYFRRSGAVAGQMVRPMMPAAWLVDIAETLVGSEDASKAMRRPLTTMPAQRISESTAASFASELMPASSF